MSSNQGVYVYALHKCASIFLYKLFEEIAREKGWKYWPNGTGDASGPGRDQWEVEQDVESSFCFCPIRHFHARRADFEHVPKERIHHFFHLRDPRDILVSAYFSFGWMHVQPQGMSDEEWTNYQDHIQNQTADEYALANQATLWDRIAPLLDVVDSLPNIHVVRYETMVLNYREWLGEFQEAFGLSQDELDDYHQRHKAEFENIAELTPEKIQQGDCKGPDFHKRKVYPGDYLDKLQPETIVALNKTFAPLARFGYDLGDPSALRPAKAG
ncbi:MAG: sulfotransferase domain-containing protein [Planctomycetales bacterium]